MSGSGDYISREAVVSSLNRLCDRVCVYSKAQREVMCGACPLGDAFTVIEDDIPAADVRPVARGKWKKEFRTNAYCEWYDCTCSRCGMAFKNFNPSNFCPNCGADMMEADDA